MANGELKDATKFFGMYSYQQELAGESINGLLKRKYEQKVVEWRQSYRNRIMEIIENQHTYKDHTIHEDYFIHEIKANKPGDDFVGRYFMNRKGRRVAVTMVYKVEQYKQLDYVIRLSKKLWPDAEFRGIVVDEKHAKCLRKFKYMKNY